VIHVPVMTPICPTCGCSLVRLRIARADATVRTHDGQELLSCCDGCADRCRTRPAADRYPRAGPAGAVLARRRCASTAATPIRTPATARTTGSSAAVALASSASGPTTVMTRSRSASGR
jgi:hypothetical protein